MPVSINKGLVIILGEDEKKEGWYFNSSTPTGFSQDSYILTESFKSLVESGKFKLIYDPPSVNDSPNLTRNRLTEID